MKSKYPIETTEELEELIARLERCFPSQPILPANRAAKPGGLRDGELGDVLGKSWIDVARGEDAPVEAYLLQPEGLAYYLPAILCWLWRDPPNNLLQDTGWKMRDHCDTLLERRFFRPEQLRCLAGELQLFVDAATPDDLYPLEPGEDAEQMDSVFDFRNAIDKIGRYLR